MRGTLPRCGPTSIPTSSVVEGDLSSQVIEFGPQRRTKTFKSNDHETSMSSVWDEICTGLATLDKAYCTPSNNRRTSK